MTLSRLTVKKEEITQYITVYTLSPGAVSKQKNGRLWQIKPQSFAYCMCSKLNKLPVYTRET